MDVLRKKKSSTLPRLVRERIIAEYLSGLKTPQMLSKEYPMSRNAIIKMVSRYRQAGNSITFDNKSILGPMKPKINAELMNDKLIMDNIELRRQLDMAHLKIEGFEIMGDILEKEYGIDLLKKAEAKQYRASKRGIRK